MSYSFSLVHYQISKVSLFCHYILYPDFTLEKANLEFSLSQLRILPKPSNSPLSYFSNHHIQYTQYKYYTVVHELKMDKQCIKSGWFHSINLSIITVFEFIFLRSSCLFSKKSLKIEIIALFYTILDHCVVSSTLPFSSD